MWKRLTFWILAAVTAVAFGRFLIFVATAYGLPSWFATPTPQPSGLALAVIFGFLLVAAAGIDIVRFFIQAAVRVKSTR